MDEILTETQCRAARALLNWSQAELAKKANLSESTIRDFEKRRRVPSMNNLAAVVGAFRQAGVMLIYDGQSTSIGGEGARFADDVSGKKLERERQEIQAELVSARSVKNYLLDQVAKSDEMKNNTAFRRLLQQAEHEVYHLEARLTDVDARINLDAAHARRIRAEMQKIENRDPEEPDE